MGTVVYKGRKFQYGQSTLLTEGEGPCPFVVVMPHVDLKELKRALKRWAGPWRAHSAWALDETDLDCYLMLTFKNEADKISYEAAVAEGRATSPAG
jgi:hypothetical protein